MGFSIEWISLKKTKKFEADFLLKLLFIIIHWSKLLYFIVIDISVDMRQHLSPWATLEQVNISVIHQFLASFVFVHVFSTFLAFSNNNKLSKRWPHWFHYHKNSSKRSRTFDTLVRATIKFRFWRRRKRYSKQTKHYFIFWCKMSADQVSKQEIFFFIYIVKLSIKKNPFDGNAIWHYNEI